MVEHSKTRKEINIQTNQKQKNKNPQKKKNKKTQKKPGKLNEAQTSNIVRTMPFWNKLHKLLLNSLDWSATLLDKQERDTIVFFCCC